MAGRYGFSEKARIEMESDSLTELDVVESISNAKRIYKTLRSTSHFHPGRREYLYVIQSTNLAGTPIYSKGKFAKDGDAESFYFLVSAKHAL